MGRTEAGSIRDKDSALMGRKFPGTFPMINTRPRSSVISEKEDGMQLQDYSISALLDFGVDPNTMKPCFSFAALDKLLTIHVNGLVYTGFSRDWDDRFSDDSHVLEVKCEKRCLSKEDLGGYGFRVDDCTAMPELTVITIEGPLNVKIICESYEISLEPLNRKFPSML
jgi:hypothetical protein